MYERILIAFDGSDTSKRALDEALQLARLTGGQVCVVHVTDIVAPLGLGLGYVPADLIEKYQDEARKQLEAVRSEAKAAGVNCETQVLMLETVTDSVAQCLQRCATRYGAQLVVLGTHGRRGVRRAFLGSVAEAFARDSECPVLLVRGQS
ncbi:universal stress protein [Paraburkholderia ferrariae]|jgi:nucleotide-binding universal stress UspA family protein|uniref:universal stress protein n=1 Tax=Paraburkholderia ferrariae TaxID=386056 RepID=UPI0004814516|nr:universal stress protein [Paraburkholderia ferrariae]